MIYKYSFDNTQQELFNEYQHDRFWIVFEQFWVLLPWMKVTIAVKGLKSCAAKTQGGNFPMNCVE